MRPTTRASENASAVIAPKPIIAFDNVTPIDKSIKTNTANTAKIKSLISSPANYVVDIYNIAA